jgi:hypothetical protein
MGKWSKKIDEKEFKISEESSKAAVRELLDFYEIEIRDEDSEGVKAVENNLNILQGYYRRGMLENDRDETLGFCVIQHLKGNDKLTYRELKTKDFNVLEGFDDKHNISRCKAILGKLCGLGVDAIEKLDRRDYQAALALALVFIVA